MTANEIDLCAVSDIAVGAMKPFEVEKFSVVIFHHSAGHFYALLDRCSHADVKLSDGEFAGDKVTCMAHGAEFDVCSGRALCMPAVRPVKKFPVRVVEGRVLVTL